MDDNWSFLYNYSRKSFDDEVSRFARLDEKAIKLLTATSVIITAFIALSKWLFSDNQANHFTAYVYILAGLVFILLCISWAFYFISLKLEIIPKMPLTDEVFELVKNKNIATVHVALYKSAKNAVEEISLIINKKSKYLVNGFKCTFIAGLLLVLFVSMIVLESGKFKSIFCVSYHQYKKEERLMSEKETGQNANSQQNTTNQQSSNEPDLDINAPNLQYATEGLDSVPDKNAQIINETNSKEK